MENGKGKMAKCETCIFWTPPPAPPPIKGPVEVKADAPKPPEQPGICKRYPPVTIVENQGAVPGNFNMGKAQSALDVSNLVQGMKAVNMVYSSFPSSMKHWLCGEWKAKDD